MYLDLFGSSDRIGGNIIDIICQISYAVKNNLYIVYNRYSLRVYNSYNQSYNNSIFLQTLFDFIDEHNSQFDLNNSDILSKEFDLASPTHFEVATKTVLNLNQDVFSFFKEKIYSDKFRNNLIKRANEKNYVIPFNVDKTILVHLRLEDVKSNPDYDGNICATFFKEIIESNKIATAVDDFEVKKINPHCNIQSPIPFERVELTLRELSLKYPDDEIVIITNPGENLSHLPYRYISNNDESYDLFLLCNSKKLVLSRSNFSLTSLLFGISDESYVPVWGMTSCLGLNTTYDKTNYNYYS